MSDITTTVEVVEEKRYTYQPKDEDGRPIGAPQVIKYHTQDELADKLSEQNTLLIRKLREETRKNRLGILDKDDIAEDAPRFEEIVEFNPRQLTNDELYELSRDLIDPEKAFDAQSKVIESTIGASPAKIGSTIRQLQEDNLRLKAKIEAEAFAAATPEYYACPQNSETIIGWMLRYNLAPVKANFTRAFEALNRQGVLVMKSEFTPSNEPVIEVPVVEKPAERPAEFIPGIGSGLSREDASDIGNVQSVGDEIVYDAVINGKIVRMTGRDAINAMPAEEYGRRFRRDPNFAKKVDKLEAQARAARKPNDA